jgi:hypothetical protein
VGTAGVALGFEKGVCIKADAVVHRRLLLPLSYCTEQSYVVARTSTEGNLGLGLQNITSKKALHAVLCMCVLYMYHGAGWGIQDR